MLAEHEYEGFKKSGSFILTTGTEVQGELCLKGGATSLDLYSEAFFDTHGSPDIFGLLHDRSKVSLINCITISGPGSSTRGDEHYHFSSVFPHFAIFGDKHIKSSDRTIRELSFTVDDAPTLFYDFDAFGSVIDARPYMERISEAREAGREIKIGENPHLFYFTGRYEIFAIDTVLGKISATHGITYSTPGPKGIHVDNTISLNLVFNSERTVDEAIASVVDILRFMEVIAGRPQNILKLVFRLANTEEHPIVLDIYWCLPPRRDCDDESQKPHPGDLPIQAAIKPDEFTGVLKRWLDRQNEWRSARTRFSTVLSYQNRYDIDRIVGAANMFDILPSSAYSETVILPPDLVQARDNARTAFLALPGSPERVSVLGALGRLGKATLKRKIRSRVKLICDIVGDQFPEIEMVLDQAVNCRNYFVHGSAAKIDYNKHFDQVQFFTDTLEFVFAASDLVEAGWDIAAWTKQGTTLSHPFGQYRVNYTLQLTELKKLL